MDAEITTLPPFESRATTTPDARPQLGTLRAALAHQTRAYIAHNAAGERLHAQLVALRADIAALEAEVGEAAS